MTLVWQLMSGLILELIDLKKCKCQNHVIGCLVGFTNANYNNYMFYETIISSIVFFLVFFLAIIKQKYFLKISGRNSCSCKKKIS
jgi:hypothetical protein